jgi:hypothetical protein
MAKRRRSNDDNITVRFFDEATQAWSLTEPPEDQRSIRLHAEKIWSYSDHNQNRLFRWDAAAQRWQPIPDAERRQLPGLQQGHDYQATPRARPDGSTEWQIAFRARCGDDDLIGFGIPESFVLRGSDKTPKPDWGMTIGPKHFHAFAAAVAGIGGRVDILAVDVAAVQDLAQAAQALDSDLHGFLHEAEGLAQITPPDPDTLARLEQILVQARQLHDRYTGARARVVSNADQIQKEPERALDKATVAALAAQLPERAIVPQIKALLDGAIAARTAALTGAPAGDPRRAQLGALLTQIYGPSVQPQADGTIRVALPGGRTLVFGQEIEIR